MALCVRCLGVGQRRGALKARPRPMRERSHNATRAHHCAGKLQLVEQRSPSHCTAILALAPWTFARAESSMVDDCRPLHALGIATLVADIRSMCRACRWPDPGAWHRLQQTITSHPRTHNPEWESTNKARQGRERKWHQCACLGLLVLSTSPLCASKRPVATPGGRMRHCYMRKP